MQVIWAAGEVSTDLVQAATFAIASEIQAKPVANPVEVQHFGVAPFLYGKDRLMRFAVQPWGGERPPASVVVVKNIRSEGRQKKPAGVGSESFPSLGFIAQPKSEGTLDCQPVGFVKENKNP